MGPLLLSRMLALNDVQQGVLQIVFKIADDNGLLLLDLKDLRAMLQYVGDNASQFTTDYGNVSAASIGAIQRGILQIDQQGGSQFFGEPMLNTPLHHRCMQVGDREHGSPKNWLPPCWSICRMPRWIAPMLAALTLP